MSQPRIAVIGAGLGGVTAGIFMQRSGYRVTVYEQAPQLERLGAGINLGANVMRVMDHIGLADEMYRTGLVPERSLSREWDTGRVLFEHRTKAWAKQYGHFNLIMHRGDLQAILASGLEPGTVQFQKQLVDLAPHGEATRMTFADGTEAEADIVIGADGVNSRVREVLFGEEAPIYTGVVAYRSIFPTALLGERGLESDFSKWWSDERLPAKEDRHFIIYHLTSRRDEVYYVTGSPAPHWDPSVTNVPVEKDEILECYAGFHPEVQRVIQASPAATKWPLLTRRPMHSWSEGGIVLLGDACHPMKPHMGQGANMAIEDGVILARCLEASGGDPFTAFGQYHATRFDRVSRVQAESQVNVWLREETDPTWVFGFDPMTEPLTSPTARSNAPISEENV